MEILFVSNLSRQAGMMETTRKQLSLQGDFPAGRVVMATPRMTWDDTWQKSLTAATVVVISWMGSSSESKWLQHTMNYLRQTGKPHLLMGSGVDQSDTGSGFSATDIDTVNRYLLYSGQNNFRNLWRWLASRFCGYAEKLGEHVNFPGAVLSTRTAISGLAV